MSSIFHLPPTPTLMNQFCKELVRVLETWNSPIQVSWKRLEGDWDGDYEVVISDEEIYFHKVHFLDRFHIGYFQFVINDNRLEYLDVPQPSLGVAHGITSTILNLQMEVYFSERRKAYEF